MIHNAKIVFNDGSTVNTQAINAIGKNRFNSLVYYSNDEQVEGVPAQIKRVEFENGKVLISTGLDFSELIIAGTATLLNTSQGFKIIANNQELVLSEIPQPDSGNSKSKKNIWKSKLYEMLKSCADLKVDAFRKLKRNRSDLTDIVSRFNECGGNSRGFEKNHYSNKFSAFGLSVGYSSHSLNRLNDDISNLGAEYDGVPITFGINYLFRPRFTSNTTVFVTGINYSSVNSTFSAEGVRSEVVTLAPDRPPRHLVESDFKSEFNLGIISVPFAIRNYFSGTNANLFLQVGASLNYLIEGDMFIDEARTRIVASTTEMINHNLSLSSALSVGFNFKVGLYKSMKNSALEVFVGLDNIRGVNLDQLLLDINPTLVNEDLQPTGDKILEGVTTLNFGLSYYFLK